MKNTLPTVSMYCDVCLLKNECQSSKTCACSNFKTNINFKTKK